MIGLVASLVCVAQTDVCAPDGSKIEGTIGQMGGQVTLTASSVVTALGAQFKAGTKVLVNVVPWGGTSGRGAIVHVEGELDHQSVIGGAKVAGTIRLGQIQGRHDKPQLVHATDFKGGTLTVKAGTIDLSAGMRLDGSVDLSQVRLQLTSSTPIHALGLDLAAGTVMVEQRDTSYAVRGTLARAQDIGGVGVEGDVAVTIEAGHARFELATLARDTPLDKLDLPKGTATRGTRFYSTVTGASFAGPLEVCGVALVPSPYPPQPPSVVFSHWAPDPTLLVNGALASPDADLGNGIRMAGPVVLGFDPKTCQRHRLEGKLTSPVEQFHLHFATRTAFSLNDYKDEQIVHGTLARPEVVDGLTVGGEITLGMAGSATRRLTAILTKPARFEAWELPARAHVDRTGTDWSFTLDKGGARAVADFKGDRFDDAREVRSNAASTTLMLARPHVVKGTSLAVTNLEIDHATGCITAGVATAQHAGMFTIPPDGGATICATTIVAAQGNFAVPSLQVGKWFATSAVAGTPGAPPTARQPQAASAAISGYWIQINSLCETPAGIPLPPPPQQWIWVDLQGHAATEADRRALASQASHPGRACPVVPCCPP